MPTKISKIITLVLLLQFSPAISWASGSISGKVFGPNNIPISASTIKIDGLNISTQTNLEGEFYLSNVQSGEHILIVQHNKYTEYIQSVSVKNNSNTTVEVFLIPKLTILKDVNVYYDKPVGRGSDISNDEIAIGKQKLVLKPNNKRANSSSLNRSINAPVNIIEYDGAGLQLGIGGRGLNPKRTAHYNTRQNGYEISADALGYPETYYTPPTEAIKEISILRGAASLQYGPQFGGMINFKLKDGPENATDTFELITSNKFGSYNQFHSFNSIATRKNKLKTYSFYKIKTGDGWRENAQYTSHTAYTGLQYTFNQNFTAELQLTHHNYVAQQSGGLTDLQFEENAQQSFRNRNWFKVNWNIAALILNYKFNKDTWINSKTFGVMANRASVGFLEDPTRVDLGEERLLITGDFQNIGNETRFIKRYKFLKGKNAAMIAGIRLYRGWAKTAQDAASSNDSPEFDLSNSPDFSEYIFPSSNIASFIENSFFITKKISVTPGYRYEKIYTGTSGYYKQYYIDNVLKVDNNSDKNRDIHLLGTGITYNAKKIGKFIFNVSQNFRSVNFSDINIVIPSFRVDENIDDEKGFTGDISYNKTFKNHAFVGLTGYYLYYANKIGNIWQTDEETFDTYQYRTNISASRTIGSELTAWVDLAQITPMNDSLQKLNWITNITLNNAKYIAEESAVYGNDVEMVPAVTVKSSLTYEYKNFAFGTLLNFQSEQFSEATNAIASNNGLYGIIPSFYVIDTKVSYKYKKVTFQSSVNNVLNKMYFTQRANSYPGPGIIPSEGRMFFGSIILKL